ncbi:MAG: NtrZ family periplasmic regulatory protein [Alphaproteobacteria bacterium]
MADYRLPLIAMTTLVLSGTASLAHAQTVAPKPAASLADTTRVESYQLNQSQQSKVLEIDGKSHWGLKLELQQPVTRDVQLKDIEAGAYYKVTPTIRVGGALGVTDAKPAAPAANGPVTPRAKIGATLKF